MSCSLDTLELTPAELAHTKEAVHRMAYFHWLEAGQPANRSLDFWLQAEREWIERYYVPHRPLEIACVPSDRTSSVSVDDRGNPKQRSRRRPSVANQQPAEHSEEV